MAAHSGRGGVHLEDVFVCIDFFMILILFFLLNFFALVHLAGCKAYANKPYPILLTFYGQYSKKPDGKKLLPFELICAVLIVELSKYRLVKWCIS